MLQVVLAQGGALHHAVLDINAARIQSFAADRQALQCHLDNFMQA